MPNKKIIIKGLHQHCEGSMFDRCGECPYYEVADEPFRCRDTLLMDVLTLLREQKPAKPFYCEADNSWSCGNCGETVGYDAYNSFGPIRNKYCKECGRKVKWE